MYSEIQINHTQKNIDPSKKKDDLENLDNSKEMMNMLNSINNAKCLSNTFIFEMENMHI